MSRTDLPHGHKLSMAGEDYLEAIYRLAHDDPDGGAGGVRSVDVADLLGDRGAAWFAGEDGLKTLAAQAFIQKL